MRTIRTRPIFDSGFPQINFGTGESSYLTTETVAGSPRVGQSVARALRGEKSLTIFIDGDSNENAGADGYLSLGARNMSILAAQDAGLVRSGFIPLGFSNYTTTIPVRTSSGGNGNTTSTDFKTNLVRQSQALATSPWTADSSGSGSVTPTRTNNDDTAPDGTQTATRIQFTRGASGFSRVQQTLTSTASQDHTLSVWMKLKSGTTSVGVGLRIGGDGTYVTTHTVTSTWQRFSYTVPAAGQPNTTVDAQIMLWSSIAGNSLSADVLVWGAQLEQAASASAHIPTTTVARSHSDVLTPMMPPSWIGGSQPIYSAPSTGDGIFFSLQSRGTHVDPRLGLGAGADTPWWSQTAGETYCDIYLLKIKLPGYGSEVIARVTATDTLAGFGSVSAVATYTSGSGGIAAANLNSSNFTTNDIAVVRVPVTFQDSGSVTRLASQINITGSGGKVAVCGVEFVRPNAKGLSFSVVSGRSGYKLSQYVNDHASAGPVYKTLADRAIADGSDIGYLPQACVNDAYVATVSTAAQYKATVQSRIAQMQSSSWLGVNTLVFLMGAPYRDSGTSSVATEDAEFDKYPSVLRDVAVSSGNVVALNLRKYLHKLGFNRASENPYASTTLWTMPTSVRGGSVASADGIDQWRLNALNPVTTLVDYSYASGTLASFPSAGYMVSVASASGAADHPLRTGNSKWYAARQWLILRGASGITSEPAKTSNDSITNLSAGDVDLVHFRGSAVYRIRSAETNLIIQAAVILAVGN
jgi:hypothetical protein